MITAIPERDPLERPILFQADSMRGIALRDKTQTRRFVNFPPRVVFDGYSPDDFAVVGSRQTEPTGTHRIPCRYGRPGGRLWVREAWGLDFDGYGESPSTITYRADGAQRLVAPAVMLAAKPPNGWRRGWRSPLRMPRWAARVLLDVVRIRVEPLLSLTEEEARAEGMVFDGRWWLGCPHPVKKTPKVFPTARDAYLSLWDYLNGGRCKRARARSNPTVWAIEFKLASVAGGFRFQETAT